MNVFVFGYGSLVSPDSVANTVGHSVDASTFSYALLADWSREWSVGSDKSSHPERTFRRSDGSEFLGVTVVMGIVPGAGACCDGAVFPVSRDDLRVLDLRERNYQRINVSDQVTWTGKPDGCVVYTYTPTKEALKRVQVARRDRRELRIRNGYLELVRTAFSQAGFPELMRAELNSVPYPTEELEAEIDDSLAPKDEKR